MQRKYLRDDALYENKYDFAIGKNVGRLTQEDIDNEEDYYAMVSLSFVKYGVFRIGRTPYMSYDEAEKAFLELCDEDYLKDIVKHLVRLSEPTPIKCDISLMQHDSPYAVTKANRVIRLQTNKKG